MIQKKYEFKTIEEMDSILSTIIKDDNYQNAKDVLIQLYNPRLDLEDEALVEHLKSQCGKATIAGITNANIADIEFDISECPVELNVTYLFKTSLSVMEFDMDQMTGFSSGRMASEALLSRPDARCMLLCYSCGSAVIHSFLNEFRHCHLPVFGIKAGRSIRKLNPAYVYGQKAYQNGIVAVIFYGKDLRIHMDNCLGFKEIGVEMLVTQTEGDNVILEINHKPATEVYSKYLKVKPNQYFVQNVCEFPLVFHRNNTVISRVPAAYDERGAIIFTSDVVKGERFRLSYGSPDILFHKIDQSAERMRKFQPQALFLFECGNRFRFLKDQAGNEPERFRKDMPDLSLAIGYAEIFYSSKGEGGALNSALVAVGLTEDATAEDAMYDSNHLADESVEAEPEEEQAYIPFVDRILHFLETTSTELDQLNKELGKMAYTDQLTKVYNRWELEHKIMDMIELGKKDHSPVSLLFMDIDHFKHVNDTYGHDVGDMVLKATVDLMKDRMDPSYVYGRWGGEEFLCALPNTTVEEAKDFAEVLRSTIEENCYVTVQHVTMSFGVTAMKETDTMDSLVKRADDALYEAKEGGRNRVKVII